MSEAELESVSGKAPCGLLWMSAEGGAVLGLLPWAQGFVS